MAPHVNDVTPEPENYTTPRDVTELPSARQQAVSGGWLPLLCRLAHRRSGFSPGQDRSPLTPTRRDGSGNAKVPPVLGSRKWLDLSAAH
jgi:hypothetical protein